MCVHTCMLLVLNVSFLVHIYLFCDCLPYFLRQVLLLNLELIDSGRLALQRAPGFTWLGLPHSTPRTGTAGTHCCTWLSHRVCILAQQALRQWPSSQPESAGVKLFTKTTLWKIKVWQKYYTICKFDLMLIGVDCCRLVKKIRASLRLL